MALFEQSELVFLRSTKDRRKAERWALVLNSKGIANIYEAMPSGEGFVLRVAPEDFTTAQNEINLYELENIPKAPEPEIELYRVNLFLFFIVFGLLGAAHYFFTVTDSSLGWYDAGRSSAELIFKGEWYRAFTALTLHSDISHVASNIVFGSIVVWGVCKLVGTGAGWFLVLMAGASGNLLNALFYHTGQHNSIGASTAVFGAVGLLSGIQFFKKFRQKKMKRWIPFAAGLALLGSLGAGKETDVLAHLFGFAAGVIIGLPAGLLFLKTGILKKYLQYMLSILTAFIVFACWFFAIW